MADEVKFVRGKNVVAAISFREATIYPTDASPGQRPEHVVAPDPRGRFHKVQHRAGNPDGVYEGDSPEYWQELTEAWHRPPRSCCSGTARAKRMRLTTGSPSSKSTEKMSPPK